MTTSTIVPEELILLRCDIDRADNLYHNGSTSPCSDAEYDAMKLRLRDLDPTDVRLGRIGAPIPRDSMRRKVKHTFLVGSIQNSNTLDPNRDYVEGLKRWCESMPDKSGPPKKYLAQLKGDGCSITAYYDKGSLTCAVTRGDGIEGEDITPNALLFKHLPSTISYQGSLAVRGEAVLTTEDFPKATGDKASNPRNLAAGICRRDDGEGSEYITFLACDLVGGPKLFTEQAKFDALRLLNFQYLAYSMTDKVSDLIDYHFKIGQIRSTVPFGIDGIVIKLNDSVAAEALGMVDNCPVGMVAVKWPAEEAKTILKDVEWSVGHSGLLAPVGTLAPVQCGGVLVSNVTLCNMDEIKRLGVGIGSTVIIHRAGDVIPKLSRVEPNVMGQTPAKIEAPVCCPVCGGPIQNRKNTDGSDTVHLYCVTERCPAKVRGRILNWAKKNDIQGLGEEVLDALMATSFDDMYGDPGGGRPHKIVAEIADLYRLRDYVNIDKQDGGPGPILADGSAMKTTQNTAQSALAGITVNGKKLGLKRALSILDEIDKTRTLTMNQFLGSLGIVHLGRRRVQMICEAFDKNVAGTEIGKWLPGTMNRHDTLWFSHQAVKPGSNPVEYVSGSILTGHAESLGIPGIATAIQADLDAHRKEIEELLTHITIAEPKPKATGEGPLKGKSFCFTGCRATPQELERLQALGGAEKSGVSAGLTFLVSKTADSTSSKAVKAKGLGVQCIGLEQFREMIK